MRRFLFGAAVVVTAGALVVGGTQLTSRLLTETPLAEGCTVEVDGGETKLDVSQAENASLIAAHAVRQDYPQQAATVALSTAYQESGLRNLDHGDRDSLGLFQQRPSQGWGSRDQISDPYYSTRTFYDHLMEVEGYQDMPVDEAAQQVQKSADGKAYAQHEKNAETLAAAFTGRTEANVNCRLVSEPEPSLGVAAFGTDSDVGAGKTDGQGGTPDPDNDSPARDSADGESGHDAGDRPGDQAPQDRADAEHAEQDGTTGADGSGNDPGDTRSTNGESDPAGAGPATGNGAAESGHDGKASGAPANPDGPTPSPDPSSPAEAVQHELTQAFGSVPDDRAQGEREQAGETGGSGPNDPAEGDAADDRDDRDDRRDQDAESGPADPRDGDARDGDARDPAEQPSSTDQAEADVPAGAEPDPAESDRAAPSNAPITGARVTGDGDGLQVTVEDRRVGWAIAHWSVANAQRMGIAAVQYDDRIWKASAADDGWTADPGSDTDAGMVRVQLGQSG